MSILTLTPREELHQSKNPLVGYDLNSQTLVTGSVQWSSDVAIMCVRVCVYDSTH